MKHTFTDPDLIELDRTWPIGQMLEVPALGTIIVAGAYEGRYLHYLSEMFPAASLHGYEPQRGAFENAKARLLGRRNVQLWNLGLGTGERRFELGNSGTDGASLLSVAGDRHAVTLLNAVETFGAYPSIDLLLLNMEGYEWALLPYLLDEMMHHRIASIALQQHTKYASKERIARVKSYLAEYYDLIYTDGQTDGWEFWRRK